MINQEVAEIFEQMAQVLEFLGDPADTFRIRAYKNASLSIMEISEPLDKLVREKRLGEIPSVGEGIAKKIEEYVATGHITEFEVLKKGIPKGFFELLQIPFLGPKKIKKLYQELGITNVLELKQAIRSGKVQAVAGFGEKSAQKILDGIGMQAANTGRRSIGEVYGTVSHIIENLSQCADVKNAVPAGSFRRTEETVFDIDILATGKNPQKIMAYFIRQPYIKKILAKGSTKSSILTKDGLQVDLRVVVPNQFGSALQYFTGSKSHNVHLRTFAKNRGFKVSEYGFFKGKKCVASKTEQECYAALGMQYIPPEMRTDTGEIEAAYNHTLPEVIQLKDIRGDLHTHSKWSDGKNSIEEMARAAELRGYEYIAITDHSPSLRVAHGLTPDRLKKKKKEIDAVQDKLKIHILFGTEVDILADGSIDYPNSLLKEFDIVVASIHSRFEQDNTARLLKAMENPFVNIIGHPSGRLIGKRKPYPINYELFFKKAAQTGTVIEINSQYRRFDLQDIYMREAKKNGCRFALDSDSHSIVQLSIMELGVAWARRGWVTKADVINTLPFEKLKKTLK